MEITYIEEDGVIKEVVKEVIDVADKLTELQERLSIKQAEKDKIDNDMQVIQGQIDSINSL